MKTLIIAPHPDDELLGCFSKILHHGDILTVVYISSGKPDEILIREKSVIDIMDSLEIIPVRQIFLRKDDSFVEDEQQLIKDIQKLIDKEKPDEILFSHEEFCHSLHDQIYNVMFKIRTDAILITYTVYGYWSFGKFLGEVMNKFTVPFGWLFGYHPRFENKPYMTYNFTKEEAEKKLKALQQYREVMGEPTKRIIKYKEENFRYV